MTRDHDTWQLYVPVPYGCVLVTCMRQQHRLFHGNQLFCYQQNIKTVVKLICRSLSMSTVGMSYGWGIGTFVSYGRIHGWPSTQPGTCTQPCPIVHTAVPPLFTQPCPHCSHSRAPGEQWARLCVFTLQGCVQAARLCRGSPVELLSLPYDMNSTGLKKYIQWPFYATVLGSNRSFKRQNMFNEIEQEST